MFKQGILSQSVVCGALALGLSAAAEGRQLRVTVENLSAGNGVYLTPFWIGFHDGNFDLYDRGVRASEALERLAEDGDTTPLSQLFNRGSMPGMDATLTEPGGFAGAPVFEPGSSASRVFDVDKNTGRYFSYASMVIPSNDAFIANGVPTQHALFDDNGNFTGPISFLVWGNQVLDAGSEENSETDAAFLNQSSPDTGAAENGLVGLHAGFNGSRGNAAGTPKNILGGTNAAGVLVDASAADFTRPGFQVARITVSDVTMPVRVNIRNLSAPGGLYNTPVWLGFHNGEFDSYSRDEAASEGLERLAEDGDASVLSDAFQLAAPTGLDTVITEPSGFAGAPVFDPGSHASGTVMLNPADHRYLSYASMLIPSNDAFVANGNPTRHQLFDASGAFTGPVNIHIMGSDVLDAGVEKNSETDAAFLNQSTPNTGEAENGVVTGHPGFNGSVANPTGRPENILGGTNAAGTMLDPQVADFTRAGSQILAISVSQAVDWSFSGAWYNPATDGEGFMVNISGEQKPVIALAWYTYSNDGSGKQLWLTGSAPILGDTAILEMFQTEGATFGPAFSSADVKRTYWGQMRFKFTDCNIIDASYDATASGYGNRELRLQRLTSRLTHHVGSCQ